MVAVRSLCVFCGSSNGRDGRYVGVARAMGSLLADRGIDLVYGGAAVGLMGELADACLSAGGRVVGVIPVGLFSREVPHGGLTELHEVRSMHERKQLMYDLADAFVALPGALGTLEEVAEVATWSQLGLHAKPLALVDVDGFWQPLVRQLDHMEREEFLRPANRRLFRVAPSPEEALAILAAADPGSPERHIAPQER